MHPLPYVLLRRAVRIFSKMSEAHKRRRFKVHMVNMNQVTDQEWSKSHGVSTVLIEEFLFLLSSFQKIIQFRHLMNKSVNANSVTNEYKI